MRLVVKILLSNFLLFLSCSLAAADTVVEIETTIQSFHGQALGTLFEVKDASGRTVAGAGFTSAESWRQRQNPRVVSFFVNTGEEGADVEDLGVPFSSRVPAQIFTWRNDLIAVPYLGRSTPRVYDQIKNRWKDWAYLGLSKERILLGVQPVRDDLLFVYADGFVFKGEALHLADDTLQGFVHFNILGDRLFIFRAGNRTRQNSVTVCRWPQDSTTISQCHQQPLGSRSANAWVMPILASRSEVLVPTTGNLYVIDGDDQVRLLREGDPTKNWQFYSSLVYKDTLLLGHYDTGNIFTYSKKGDTPESMVPRVSKQPQAMWGNREVQGLTFHRGYVVASLWPWGEIWAGTPGAEWNLLTRLFSLPPVDESPGPFDARVIASRLPTDLNALGQRVFSMTNWSTGLAVAAANKQTSDLAALSLLNDDELRPYGRVFLVSLPHEISCELPEDQRIDLKFVAGATLAIRSDGKTICEKPLSTPIKLKGAIIYGKGQWGQFSGQLHRVEAAIR